MSRVASMGQSDIVRALPELTVQETLEAALLYLAHQEAYQDVAHKVNGVGFSQATAWWRDRAEEIKGGKRLFGKLLNNALQPYMTHYKNQLAPAGFPQLTAKQVTDEVKRIKSEYVASTLAERDASRAEPARPERLVELAGDRIVVYSVYEDYDLLRSILPAGYWEKSQRRWNFPLDSAVALMKSLVGYTFDERVKALNVQHEETEIKVEEVAHEITTNAVDSNAKGRRNPLSAERVAFIKATFEFMAKQPLADGRILHPHQVEAGRVLIHEGRFILSDGMGLGKTTETYVAASCYGLPIVVVCPAGAQLMWHRESARTGIPCDVFSFERAPSPEYIRKTLGYDDCVLIVDEAHYLQNWGSYAVKADGGTKIVGAMLQGRGVARTARLMAHRNQWSAIFCLTGTPMPNGRAANLLPLFYLIGADLSDDLKWYWTHYCAAEKLYGTWNVNRNQYQKELYRKIKAERLIMLRLKHEVLPNLPKKTREMLECKLSPQRAAEYNRVLMEVWAEYEQRKIEMAQYRADHDLRPKDSSRADTIVWYNKLFQAGETALLDEAVEMARELIEQGQKVVAFFSFPKNIEEFNRRLSAMKFIDQEATAANENGETIYRKTHGVFWHGKHNGAGQRQGYVDTFQSDPNCMWVATSFKAGGTVYTLTAAYHVLVVGRPWKPGDAEQAEDRCHRMTTTQPVKVYWLSLAGDIPNVYPHVNNILTRKARDTAAIMRGESLQDSTGTINVETEIGVVLDLVFNQVRDFQNRTRQAA